jgi:hypothetical protein
MIHEVEHQTDTEELLGLSCRVTRIFPDEVLNTPYCSGFPAQREKEEVPVPVMFPDISISTHS